MGDEHSEVPGVRAKGGGVYFEVRGDDYSTHLPGRRCPQSPPVGSHGVGSAGREGASRVRVRSPCRWGGAHNEPSACDDPSNACGAWKKSKSTTTFFLEL